MSKLFILGLILIMAASCAKKETPLEQISSNLNEISANKYDQTVSELTAPKSSFTTNILNSVPTDETKNNNEKFTEAFCESFKNSQIVSRYDDEIFSEKGKKLWKQYTVFFSKNSFTCISDQTLLDAYPNAVVKLSSESKKFALILTIKSDQRAKIDQFHMMAMPDNFQLKRDMISVDEDVSLGTYSLFIQDKKAPVVFLKTPYLSYSMPSFMAQTEYYIRAGYHVVTQSNRGSYESSGHFKWLHKENIKDQGTTLDWIATQEFYRDGIIASGASYDGFNSLTAAATNNKNLKAVIACSAPTNARTDSFTANEIVEFAHLLYLTLVKEGYSFDIYTIARKLILEGTPLHELDNKILGRNEPEWDETLNLENKGSTYFQDRDLTPLLKNIEVPTLIVGGFNEDQDGRDSILSYKEISQNPNIGGYFHQYGHGCGKLNEETFMTNTLKSILNNESVENFKKLIVKYSDKEYISDSDIFPMEKETINLVSYTQPNNPNEKTGLFFIEDYIFGTEKESRSIFIADKLLDQDLKVFGEISVSTKVKSYSPFNALNLAMYYIDPKNQLHFISRLFTSPVQSRSQVLIRKANVNQQIHFELPPAVAVVPKGSRIVVELSSSNVASYPLRKKMRVEYSKMVNQKMGLTILENPVISISKEPVEN